MFSHECGAGSGWSLVVRLVLFSGLASGVGCGGLKVELPGGELPSFDDGASKGADVKRTVTEDGATLELMTGAKLTIPAGAVREDVEITVERPADAQALQLLKSLPDLEAVASAPYVLTPHGLVFDEPVRLELPISPDQQGKALDVAWLENERSTDWRSLGAAEVAGDTATITLQHFSVVVLIEHAASGGLGRDGGQRDPTPPDVEMRADAGTTTADAGGSVQPREEPACGDPGIAGRSCDGGVPDELPDAAVADAALPDAAVPDSGSDTLECGELELCPGEYGAPDQCVDTSSDVRHCGGCAPSPAAARGPDCWLEPENEHQRACVTGCTSGEDCSERGECSGSPSGEYACETELGGSRGIYCTSLNTRQFCGDCNTSCAPEESCSEGTCVPRSCPEGQRPCGYFCRDEALSCGEACSAEQVCAEGSCQAKDG